MAAVPSYGMEGCNKHKMAAWLSAAEVSQSAE
jgi:hypothetical protein